jgi:hypothetical protein
MHNITGHKIGLLLLEILDNPELHLLHEEFFYETLKKWESSSYSYMDFSLDQERLFWR